MTDVRRTVDPRRLESTPAGQENIVAAKKPMRPMEEEPEPQIIIEERIKDKEGNEYVKKYLRGKFLGKGGFARCYELKDLQTNHIFAAKVVAKNTLTKKRAKDKLTAEIKIHRSLHHTQIVKFEHFFEDHENVYILLEMCNQKSMMELIRKRGTLTEMEARYYLLQIISAVKYMHDCRVIHRDLKLGNLFLNNMQIKIGDFGLAAKLDHDGQRKKTICGTPNYIAPEILEGTNGHSYEVDIWSLGVILYTLLIGKPPFETKDVKTTYVRIKANMWSFPEKVPVSECAKSLIRRILHTVPEARPTLDEMLLHPFFSGGYSVPKLLPSSALYQPPSPAKSPNKMSPYRSTTSPSAYQKSPSRIPLSERTNTNGSAPITGSPGSNFVPSQLNNNYAPNGNPTMGSQRQLYQTQITTQSNAEPEEGDDSHSRKLRKIEKTRETADLRTLFLKSRIAEPENIQQTTTQPTLSSTSIPLTASQSYSLQQPFTSTTTSALPPQLYSPQTQMQTPMQTQIMLNTLQQPAPTQQIEMETNEEDDNINVMHQKLEGFFVKGVAEQANPSTIQSPTVWVVKWVDYSNKYGLGYQLSNNIFGAYFNDSTKMMAVGNSSKCEYIENARNASIERKSYLLDPPTPHSHQLNKKITLLKYFKNYLLEQPYKVDDSAAPASSTNLVYVKKWLRTKHAIVFRLSNKIVQVNFFDHTKIILSSEATVITYINQNKQTVTQSLTSIVQNPPSKDLVDRLKYIRDILHNMLDKKAKPKQ